MYKDLTKLRNPKTNSLDIEKYRELYNRVYCVNPLVTFDGIEITFEPDCFDHAFFKSDYYDDVKDRPDERRLSRILWIKEIISDSKIPRYLGWNKRKKRYTNESRVTFITNDNYVVVIRFTDKKQTKAKFVTAYVANNESCFKIKQSPSWQK